MHTGQIPGQPSENEWKFIQELQTNLHKKIPLSRRNRKDGEASLDCGVELDFRFPDDQTLSSAYADFRNFLEACNINTCGRYRIIAEKIRTDSFETYIVEVAKNSCRILANDTEGIRRGLVFVEDEIQRAGGPFLTIGRHERSPFIKTRISRCFFGPIKRPPMNRDELADNIDYYPEEYLNRLAHEAVNGLWLSIEFRDLCPSRFFPDHGKDSKKRLLKLKQTVERCARYGIKIYLYCNEPIGFGSQYYNLPFSKMKNNPWFAGHKESEYLTYFCTASKEGREYLGECTEFIFSQVPGLGGLIDINLGERPTHCYSNTGNFFNNNCPRCSKRKPWEVFHDTISALENGMHSANPEAEMISWLYVPAITGKDIKETEKINKVIREIALHMPENILLQYNFESNGKAIQLGKERVLLDYWLAWPGPSKIFADCAKNAVSNKTRVSAKVQVGCSHEVATVPFVPVPGNLYKKYNAMKKLQVSSAMQCWYFGNYPGLMNKTAGELSFTPFPKSEDEFLFKTAQIDWGTDVEKVVQAWKYFQKGYSSFPFNLSFTWYGPIHNSIVWPLYLNPVDKPIAPSWKFTFPLESGDRIGECICYDHTLTEILKLLKKMSENWSTGVKILKEIEPGYKDNRERILDIGLAKALNIQINSAYNVFTFYSMREKLPYLNISEQRDKLEAMKNIVSCEIDNSLALRKLCLLDSRLGFHSEAEGYKYFPAKLRWRSKILEDLLFVKFPAIEKRIESGSRLFAEYTGAKPEGKKYISHKNARKSRWEKFNGNKTKWKAWYDAHNIYFVIKYTAGYTNSDSGITLKIEPCRLWPAQTFRISEKGEITHDNFRVIGDDRWKVKITHEERTRRIFITIPFMIFEGYFSTGRPMRINLLQGRNSWKRLHPLENRLRFGTDNPADLGWLLFK
ncbi:MAG: hypothetical protein JW957_09190 [Candidatus Omnitrophica bacterium]|nr:hypothetical protein [Candidatus Omnitrophota bacterium]